MQSSNLPARVPAPFAVSGAKNPIPLPSQASITPGAASWTDGFPVQTMQPKASGGLPPSGQDFNGVLNAISAVAWWVCAGGAFPYDATFSGQIGGYPLGARLARGDGAPGFWISTAENNTNNPDAGGANWLGESALGHGNCRLTYTSATALVLKPYNGNGILVGGAKRVIPSAGVTASNSGLSASTLYFVYAAMVSGALALEFSTTGHATDSATGVEVKSTDATRTLVGMIYTNASSQFTESNSSRCVSSWFNRKPKPIVVGSTTYSTPSSTPVPATGIAADFVVWAEDVFMSSASGSGSNNSAGGAANVQVALDGNTSFSTSGVATSASANQVNTVVSVGNGVSTEGRHQLAVYMSTLAAGTMSATVALIGTVWG